MNTHIITGGYANRVRNFNTYSAISKDIIHRWTYPMVPDNNWLAASSYQHSRPHIYKERNVKLAQYVAHHSLALTHSQSIPIDVALYRRSFVCRSCKIGKDTVIGEQTVVGEFANIQSSVIGRNCSIGNHVTITNSFIWDNTVIEDHVTIDDSLLCRGVTIKKNSRLLPGCVVSFNVTVGPDCTLPAETKVTTIEDPSVRFDDETEGPLVESINLGPGNTGWRWIEDRSELTNSLALTNRSLIDTLEDDESDSDIEAEQTVSEFERTFRSARAPI